MRELKKKRVEIEKARKIGLFGRYDTQLLELRFLINHMLASNRVILGNFHLARARTLVLGRSNLIFSRLPFAMVNSY